jgi:hypothetical protein
MPRYFFHFVSPQESVPDAEGVELRDPRAAHLHAIKLVQQTMPFIADGPDWRGWVIDVRDGDRRSVLTVLFPAKRSA